MKCLKCGADTRGTETVTLPDGVYRRRKCTLCGDVIYTTETPISKYLFREKRLEYDDRRITKSITKT